MTTRSLTRTLAAISKDTATISHNKQASKEKSIYDKRILRIYAYGMFTPLVF